MGRTTKAYNHDGLAGCVTRRKSQRTGHLVGLYHAWQADLDYAGGRWATVCEQHGVIVNHTNRKVAIAAMAQPDEWCEDCRAQLARLRAFEAQRGDDQP